MIFFRLLALAGVAALCTQCAQSPAVAPQPTFDEASITAMQDVAPYVAGDWKLNLVHVQYQQGFMFPDHFPHDTLIQQFATLRITPAQRLHRSVADPHYPEYDGQLTYRGVTYQLYFSLMGTGDYVLRRQGPPATFLLDYIATPGPPRPTTADEQFLEYLGLFGGNFSLELSADKSRMLWRGWRNIERIELGH